MMCASCKANLDKENSNNFNNTFGNPQSDYFSGKFYCNICYERVKIWIERKRAEKEEMKLEEIRLKEEISKIPKEQTKTSKEQTKLMDFEQ